MYLQANSFFRYFGCCIWRVSPSDKFEDQNTKSNFLRYIDARFRDHFIPGKNLSVEDYVVGFKGKISFITYTNKKKELNGESVSMFWHTSTSYGCSFIPYHGKITTERLIKPDLPFTSRIVQLFHNTCIRETRPDINDYHIFTERFYTSPTLASQVPSLELP
jgi:hypothetical protein